MKNEAESIQFFPLAQWLNDNYNMRLETGFTVEIDPREQLPYKNK